MQGDMQGDMQGEAQNKRMHACCCLHAVPFMPAELMRAERA